MEKQVEKLCEKYLLTLVMYDHYKLKDILLKDYTKAEILDIDRSQK